MKFPVVGECWEHVSSGEIYRVIALSRDHETHEILVTYHLFEEDDHVWTRPLNSFLGFTKDRHERFELCSED